jgi:hypothetical protein
MPGMSTRYHSILTPRASSRVLALMLEARGTDILTIREIGPWGERPVWSVLTDLYEYVRDRVVIPLKPFFVASHFSSP